jgi:hypothetical protein
MLMALQNHPKFVPWQLRLRDILDEGSSSIKGGRFRSSLRMRCIYEHRTPQTIHWAQNLNDLDCKQSLPTSLRIHHLWIPRSKTANPHKSIPVIQNEKDGGIMG